MMEPHAHAASVIAAFRRQADHHSRSSSPASASATSAADFAALLEWSYRVYSSSHTASQKTLRVTEMKALHRGVYKCVATLPSFGGDDASKQTAERTITFVLKTECRPPSKWHGQQSYTEVATNALVEIIFGPDGAYGPYARVNGARGVVVEISSAHLATVIHKDRCGVLAGPADLEAAELTTPTTTPSGGAAGDKSAIGESSAPIYVIGAALQWNPAHRDDALPNTAVLEYFQFQPAASEGRAKVLEADAQRTQDGTIARALPRHPALVGDIAELETLRQMADVLTVDYLVSSIDRTDRNWFRVSGAVPISVSLEVTAHGPAAGGAAAHATAGAVEKSFGISYAFPSPAERQRASASVRGAQRRSVQNEKDSRSTLKSDLTTRNSRFFQMDNGWAFSGRDYGGSICDVEPDALRCPPILQYLSRSRQCKYSSANSLGGTSSAAVADSVTSCRMRRTTAAAITHLKASWNGGVNAATATSALAAPNNRNSSLGAEWGRRVRADPLMRFLLRRFGGAPDTYGGQPDNRGGAQSSFNVALARFTTGCPSVAAGGGDAIDLLVAGIGRRLVALDQHMRECVDHFGVAEVLL
jgi:hypothetical protein